MGGTTVARPFSRADQLFSNVKKQISAKENFLMTQVIDYKSF
jgi:hypothetical protein